MEKENRIFEKRKSIRKSFEPREKPRLKIGAHEFMVNNISENGLCLLNEKKINLSGWVTGTLTFPDNSSKEIDAIVVRNRDREIGLHLVG